MGFLMMFLFASCEGEEGKGGRATIKGKVYVTDFNQEGMLVVEDYVGDWDVFITYGDSGVVDDATVTNFDGSYEFEYLYEGNYTVFAYSKCNSCPNNIEPITLNAEITEASQVLVLPDLNVID